SADAIDLALIRRSVGRQQECVASCRVLRQIGCKKEPAAARAPAHEGAGDRDLLGPAAGMDRRAHGGTVAPIMRREARAHSSPRLPEERLRLWAGCRAT